jgi:glycosyltransferase involved in cell wall biosynthesis
VPDVVTQNVDGFLVEARDVKALAAVLQQAFTERKRLGPMGLSGRRKVESLYAPSRVVDQVDALYRQCLSASARSHGSRAG